MARKRWTVGPGRTLLYDGDIVAYLSGLEDRRRGLLYYPVELDALTQTIAEALNRHRPAVSGIPVMRVRVQEDPDA